MKFQPASCIEVLDGRAWHCAHVTCLNAMCAVVNVSWDHGPSWVGFYLFYGLVMRCSTACLEPRIEIKLPFEDYSALKLMSVEHSVKASFEFWLKCISIILEKGSSENTFLMKILPSCVKLNEGNLQGVIFFFLQ